MMSSFFSTPAPGGTVQEQPQPPLPTLRDAVRQWQLNGFSLIPIRVDGTKRPATRWQDYIATAPTLEQVEGWWANGHTYGIAVICGTVSGNLEMTEIEGRAFTYDNITEIRNLLDEAGHADLWDYLNSTSGYVEQSPSGGIHFLYRIGDHEVPGNTKLANRYALDHELTEDEYTLLAQDPTKRFVRGLAETRGEGGYVIVAPTPGVCHKTGEPWRLVSGELGVVPLISWDQRNALHAAVKQTLGGLVSEAYSDPRPVPILYPPVESSGTGPLSPGDDFTARVDWEDHDLLGGGGWVVTKRQGQYREWCRPGKNPREGMSATTGKEAVDRLFVFSTSTTFPTEVPISKFHAYALLHHGGNHTIAARELRRRGFGERASSPELDDFRPLTPTPDHPYTLNDDGNMQRLWDRVGDRYRYVEEANTWFTYSGRTWEPDATHSLMYQFRLMAREMAASDDEQEAKFGFKCGNASRMTAAVNNLKSTPGASISLAEFDNQRGLLNVHNGVLNLRTGELKPHDSTLLMTQLFNASYDPNATCENFEAFMEQVLPDGTLRSYVQRALGYTLLGDADQKAMFLIHGPSNTGKSTLMETIRDVFGSYGVTAPSGTFKSRAGSDHGPTADLHTLRGRRFVSTSETAESAAFDEDLLKRLTGRDQVQSRGLYESNVEWTPQLVLWLATNHPPRLNSDDDAVWRRLKMIPLLHQFTHDDEIHDMARKQLMPERNGILNWLLAGLRDYLAFGLDEPESIAEASKEQRVATDSVARFLDDKILEGVLVEQPGGMVRSADLYTMYQDWARAMREHPVGSRRFTNRMLSNFTWLANEKISGHRVFVGLARFWGTHLPES